MCDLNGREENKSQFNFASHLHVMKIPHVCVCANAAFSLGLPATAKRSVEWKTISVHETQQIVPKMKKSNVTRRSLYLFCSPLFFSRMYTHSVSFLDPRSYFWRFFPRFVYVHLARAINVRNENFVDDVANGNTAGRTRARRREGAKEKRPEKVSRIHVPNRSFGL